MIIFRKIGYLTGKTGNPQLKTSLRLWISTFSFIKDIGVARSTSRIIRSLFFRKGQWKEDRKDDIGEWLYVHYHFNTTIFYNSFAPNFWVIWWRLCHRSDDLRKVSDIILIIGSCIWWLSFLFRPLSCNGPQREPDPNMH